MLQSCTVGISSFFGRNRHLRKSLEASILVQISVCLSAFRSQSLVFVATLQTRPAVGVIFSVVRSEEHTSELQSRPHLVCRILLEKKKKKKMTTVRIYID